MMMMTGETFALVAGDALPQFSVEMSDGGVEYAVI